MLSSLVLAAEPWKLKLWPRKYQSSFPYVSLGMAVPGTMGPGEGPPQRGDCSPSPSPYLTLQLPLSSSHLNVYSGDPQVTASLVGVTSSSCPADLTQKRELTGITFLPLCALAPRPHPSSPPSQLLSPLLSSPDAESRALAKERQKKDNHNLSESSAPPRLPLRLSRKATLTGTGSGRHSLPPPHPRPLGSQGRFSLPSPGRGGRGAPGKTHL